ncbi:MAG TPA: 5-deoxy-glucuronate isomerase [Acidimicrobiia bacterium]|jgi:5-deoxy-glucuronate isomerase
MDSAVLLKGERCEPLLTAGSAGRLGAARTLGPARGQTRDAVAWVVVERGAGRLVAGDAVVEVAGRDEVFERPGWSALVGRSTEFAIEGDLAATTVWCAADRDVTTRMIDPEEVEEEERGDGPTRRRVRTYVPDGPLIVGETLNPPGGWSSWPPHRHEHEECYLYRFTPAHGFGVHVGFDDASGEPVDRPVLVRDGHIERITDGWHPVVAAPGATMYYLWALAGDTDSVDTRVDPRFE